MVIMKIPATKPNLTRTLFPIVLSHRSPVYGILQKQTLSLQTPWPSSHGGSQTSVPLPSTPAITTSDSACGNGKCPMGGEAGEC